MVETIQEINVMTEEAGITEVCLALCAQYMSWLTLLFLAELDELLCYRRRECSRDTIYFFSDRRGGIISEFSLVALSVRGN